MTLLGLFITWYSHSIEKTDNVSGGLEMFQNSILFTAGQFARLHHLNKRTLHYYDDIGLFSPAYKGRNGYRYYTYQQSGELESILALRELNMSIGEIKEYLNRPTAQRFIELSEKKSRGDRRDHSEPGDSAECFKEKTGNAASQYGGQGRTDRSDPL